MGPKARETNSVLEKPELITERRTGSSVHGNRRAGSLKAALLGPLR